MSILNTKRGFSWASSPSKNGLAKVSIGGESFWVRQCVENNSGIFTGLVDNELICSDAHGLSYNDEVSFRPTT